MQSCVESRVLFHQLQIVPALRISLSKILFVLLYARMEPLSSAIEVAEKVLKISVRMSEHGHGVVCKNLGGVG